jgi:dihydroneopterin aldolase
VDRILMEGMAFFGRHGVFPAERELGARFTVDVELFGDLTAAALSDRLDSTIDYARAYELVKEVVEGDPCHLLEAVAQRIADRLLQLPRVERATVRVQKRPPLEGEFRSFGVELTRAKAG